jgi:hypothetical protein
MTGPVFLDTCILFSAIENTSNLQTLRHLRNLNYQVCISLPVLGEFISEVGAVHGKDPIMRGYFNLIDMLEPAALYPNSRVSWGCFTNPKLSNQSD